MRPSGYETLIFQRTPVAHPPAARLCRPLIRNHTIDNCGAKVPTDTVSGPWNFAGNEYSAIWQWGSIVTDPAATETWANEAYVDSQMQQLKTTLPTRAFR